MAAGDGGDIGGKNLDYAGSGVSIDAGDELVRRIGPAAAATRRPGVMGAIGGFGGMFDLAAAGWSDPILVAATDGVGTKLRVAIDANQLGGVGVDLVAMCVNDLICQGAEPLFFLDYFATSALEVDQAARVVGGVAAGCKTAGCALLGGETAEMPGFYAPGEFDLAGFAVGAVYRSGVLPREVAEGDVLIALASSGAHSNGFSLIRRIVDRSGLDWDAAAPFDPSRCLADALLEPTRIYTDAAKALRLNLGVALRGMAHITGGGLTENTARMLPAALAAEIDMASWRRPALFDWMAEAGPVAPAEMLRVFNCGVGLIAAVQPNAEAAALATLRDAGETAWRIGQVRAATDAGRVIYVGADA